MISSSFLFFFFVWLTGTCGFGIECNSLKDPNAEFRYYGAKIFGKPRHSPMFFILLEGFNWLGRTLRIKVMADDISNFFLKAIRETVEHREANNTVNKRNDFMDVLINLKNQETGDADKRITMNDIAGNAFVFFLAGFGSLSNTLTFCLYELAIDQAVQRKARQVIRTALEKRQGQFTYEMMMDMPYIDQIINGERLFCCCPVTISMIPFKLGFTFGKFNRNSSKISIVANTYANDKEKLSSSWNWCSPRKGNENHYTSTCHSK